MKKLSIIILLAGVFHICFPASARADVLDNWTTNQISTNIFGMHHIVYGNGLFVAVGESGDSSGYYYSTDNSHWKLAYTESSSWGANLIYVGGHYASVRSSLSWASIANVSADGTNWTTTFFPDGTAAFAPLAATYGNSMYVVVGATNSSFACIMTSPDGTTWTYRKASTSPGGPLNSVTYGAGKFVAVGNNDGLEYTSTTGTSTWAKSSLSGGNTISFANGLFFVPLNEKTNLLSVDGINWNPKATGLTNLLGAVTYGNGIFMAQCGIASSGSYLATSTDGTNWFQYVKKLPNFCAIGDAPNYDVSLATDGIRLVTVGAGYQSPNSFNPNSFNGFIYTADVLGGIRMTNAPTPKVALSGLVGRRYQILSTDALPAGSNNWHTNATLQLTNTLYMWTDATATNPARFYRGALLP